jgi:hypothetical protein
MGIEFVRKAAKSFHKGLDRRRMELATPDLFTRHPSIAPRSYAATLRTDHTAMAGEKLGVRLEGQDIFVLRGLDRIAVFNSPPIELKDALHASHGEACGHILQVHAMAGIVEIAIC